MMPSKSLQLFHGSIHDLGELRLLESYGATKDNGYFADRSRMQGFVQHPRRRERK